MAVSAASMAFWMGLLDKAILLAFAFAEIIARLRAGKQVTDEEARPTPRAEIEARVLARYREQMLDDATIIGRGTDPT